MATAQGLFAMLLKAGNLSEGQIGVLVSKAVALRITLASCSHCPRGGTVLIHPVTKIGRCLKCGRSQPAVGVHANSQATTADNVGGSPKRSKQAPPRK